MVWYSNIIDSIDIQVNTSSGIKDVVEVLHSILEEKQDQRNEEDRTEKINEEVCSKYRTSQYGKSYF